MKYRLALAALIAVTALAFTVARPTAVLAADYSNSHLLDDEVLDNVSAMDESQIQAFLVSKGSCLASYSDIDPTWNGTTWTYTGSATAAHTIAKVSAQWGINPQVLLATLQKEQSLIQGRPCVAPQIISAMGYDCPDSGTLHDYPAIGVTGTCVAHQKNAGFARQVLWAGWQLKFGRERSEGITAWDDDGDITYVGYMTQGTFKRCAACSAVTYDGNATIDGQVIHLDNGATASLYSYTPHLGQSFPGIFESYFGSILWHGDDPTGSFDLVQQVPGAVRVAGWGLDRSMPGSAAAIHVYIDGTWQGAITADGARADVGAHGFDNTVPYTTPGTHQVCVWVVGDNLGAPNMGLGCRAVFINDDPTGSLDFVQAAPGAVRLAGWGLDRSTTAPAAIHVYIDGTWQGAITANGVRGDVGAHGFDNLITYGPSGTHQVCAWVVGDNLGAPNAGLGCRAVFLNNDPTGSLDVAQQVPGAVRLAGWGLDRSTTAPAAIHVYIDGTWQGAITANGARADVGAHGFDSTLAYTTGGTHQVCAWVVGDNLGAPNAGLGCRAVFLNNDPTGSLDLVQGTSGGVRLAGWGLDRSMSGPAAIHVYIDGTWQGAITANGARADVGAHGFDTTLAYGPSGTHQVCAWVVGDNLGAPNAGLGCRSFSN